MMETAKRLLACDPVLQAPTYFHTFPHACQTYGDILSMQIYHGTNSCILELHDRGMNKEGYHTYLRYWGGPVTKASLHVCHHVTSCLVNSGGVV